jgi:hypothetical protein
VLPELMQTGPKKKKKKKQNNNHSPANQQFSVGTGGKNLSLMMGTGKNS